jgi:hypothetical protein
MADDIGVLIAEIFAKNGRAQTLGRNDIRVDDVRRRQVGRVREFCEHAFSCPRLLRRHGRTETGPGHLSVSKSALGIPEDLSIKASAAQPAVARGVRSDVTSLRREAVVVLPN